MKILRTGKTHLPKLKKYALTIIYNNENAYPYNFTNVIARTSEEAVCKMKAYVANSGRFIRVNKDAVIANLKAINVRVI